MISHSEFYRGNTPEYHARRPRSFAAAEEYTAAPHLTTAQRARMTRLRPARRKDAVSVRLDPQVLDWLRAKGEGHLTGINDILTNLMEAERRAGSGRYPPQGLDDGVLPRILMGWKSIHEPGLLSLSVLR